MLAYSLPNHSHQDYVNADKKLNVEFDKLIADLTAAQLRDGQVSKPPAMIRDAERAG